MSTYGSNTAPQTSGTLYSGNGGAIANNDNFSITAVRSNGNGQQHHGTTALDPNPGAQFTLQVFDDNESRKDAGLAATFHGTVGKHERLKGRFTLHEAIARGCGVYCTVNETNGRGREAGDVVRFRAVWVEDDNDDGLSAERIYPLEPTFIVESSPEHFHKYWCITDEWPADEQGIVEFNGVIERMVAEHHCCKGAKGVNRVLRVPGFLHRKDSSNPYVVRLVKRDGPRHTRAQILAAFPPVVETAGKANGSGGSGGSSEWKDLLNDVISGDNFHEPLTVLAAKMLRSGMSDGAAVQLLRGLMENSEAPHDDRWRARYLEIPRGVATARAKGILPEAEGVRLDDFRSYMPMAGSHIYMPTGEMWPSSSVNSRLPPQMATDAKGDPHPRRRRRAGVDIRERVAAEASAGRADDVGPGSAADYPGPAHLGRRLV
jgi:hypothetical protein